MNKKLLWLSFLSLMCSFCAAQTQYNVLHSFGSQAGDGAVPLGSLVLDRSGNLYGTTSLGGTSACGQCGTIFELSPNTDGSWTESVIYNFCSNVVNSKCADGSYPKAGLALDSSGNLYGTTFGGGSNSCTAFSGSCGVIFELSPPSQSGQSWTETVLYSFCSNEVNEQCLDGVQPKSQLIFDASGNLYGTTSAGGSGHFENGFGSGVVFELSPIGGKWAETVLYNFCTLGDGDFCPDGSEPQAGLTFDEVGNLYGTTQLGGAINSEGGGTAYKLIPGSNGKWTEVVLYTPHYPYNNGSSPMGTVSLDPVGNLYSTLSASGPYGLGGVFRILPKGKASVFSFDGENGGKPTAGVLIDTRRDALFGTSTGGGANPYGNVYEIKAPSQELVLYNFCSQVDCTDGSKPQASLIEDRSGHLYGTASAGGSNNVGVVFEIIQSLPERRAQSRPVWRVILPTQK